MSHSDNVCLVHAMPQVLSSALQENNSTHHRRCPGLADNGQHVNPSPPSPSTTTLTVHHHHHRPPPPPPSITTLTVHHYHHRPGLADNRKHANPNSISISLLMPAIDAIKLKNLTPDTFWETTLPSADWEDTNGRLVVQLLPLPSSHPELRPSLRCFPVILTS